MVGHPVEQQGDVTVTQACPGPHETGRVAARLQQGNLHAKRATRRGDRRRQPPEIGRQHAVNREVQVYPQRRRTGLTDGVPHGLQHARVELPGHVPEQIRVRLGLADGRQPSAQDRERDHHLRIHGA